MSFFNWGQESVYKNMSDFEAGMDVLRKYYELSKSYRSRDPMRDISYSEFESKIMSTPKAQSKIKGIGLGVKFIEFDQGQVSEAMDDLAATIDGKIPADLSVFRQALNKEAQDIHIARFLDEVVVKSAADIAKGSQNIGKGVITGGKELLSWAGYTPLILAGGGTLAILAYFYAKGSKGV